MNRFATIFVAFGLATAGSSALAGQAKDQVSKQNPKPQPVQMSDAQMDKVAGGALLNVLLLDVVDVRNVSVDVAVPVNAAVAANVLGGTAIAGAAQPGRIRQ
jgi:hypothetical protein